MPFHLSRPSSAGPASGAPCLGPCSPAERGVSTESEIMDKGPGPVLVEASAGWCGQGSRGKPQLNPPCWLVTAPAPRQREPELREGLTYPLSLAKPFPMPGITPPCHPPREPLGDAGRHPTTAHSGLTLARIPGLGAGEGQGRGGLLELIWTSSAEEHCEPAGSGAPGARQKGSTGSQVERSHSDHLRGLDIFGK